MGSARESRLFYINVSSSITYHRARALYAALCRGRTNENIIPSILCCERRLVNSVAFPRARSHPSSELSASYTLFYQAAAGAQLALRAFYDVGTQLLRLNVWPRSEFRANQRLRRIKIRHFSAAASVLKHPRRIHAREVFFYPLPQSDKRARALRATETYSGRANL